MCRGICSCSGRRAGDCQRTYATACLRSRYCASPCDRAIAVSICPTVRRCWSMKPGASRSSPAATEKGNGPPAAGHFAGLSAGLDDDLAHRLTGTEGVQCSFVLIQFEGLGHQRLELALAVPLEQLTEVVQVGLGLTGREGAPEHPDHGGPLEQRQVYRQLGTAAAGKAHHQQATLPVDAAHALIEQVASNRIIDHIGALAAGQLLALLLEVALA